MKQQHCEISNQQEGREDPESFNFFFFLAKDQESERHWKTQQKLWKLEVKITRENNFQPRIIYPNY